LRGELLLTPEKGTPEHAYAGHGRWLLPGKSDQLRFPLSAPLQPGLYELSLKIETGDHAAPFEFREVLKLSE
jgi:hypothetical protein